MPSITSADPLKPNLPTMTSLATEAMTMTTPQPISPELKAKIDALPDGNLKTRILRAVTGPGKRTVSNEEIFENIMESVAEAKAQRARWRQWRDDEVLAFVEHFKNEMPDDYADFLKQEHENNEIDDDLWWRVGHLADRWIPDLDFHDCTSLLGKVRDHFRALLK